MRNSTKLIVAVLMLLTVSATAFASVTYWQGTAGAGSQPLPEWLVVGPAGIPMNPWRIILDNTTQEPQYGKWGNNYYQDFVINLLTFEEENGVIPAVGEWYYHWGPNFVQGTLEGDFDFVNGTASGTWTFEGDLYHGSYTGNWEGQIVPPWP